MITDEYDEYGNPKRLLNQYKQPEQEQSTTLTVSALAPEKTSTSTMDRIQSLFTKKKSPEETPGTLASMIQQGKVLKQTKSNIRQQDIKRFKQGVKSTYNKLSKYGKRYAAIPKKLSGSAQGARRIEKDYRYAKAASTGIAGMIFPQSGLQKRKSSKGMARGQPGRPAGVYKHVIPGVGPVHVYTWRKWVRAQKAKALQGRDMKEQQITQAMIKRGLSPQMAYLQAQQLQRLREQGALQEAQQAQQQAYYNPSEQYYQQPQQMQPRPHIQAQAPITQARVNPFARQQQPMPTQGMKPVYDIFTGRTRLEPNRVGPERWSNDQSSISRPGQIGLRKNNQQGGYI